MYEDISLADTPLYHEEPYNITNYVYGDAEWCVFRAHARPSPSIFQAHSIEIPGTHSRLLEVEFGYHNGLMQDYCVVSEPNLVRFEDCNDLRYGTHPVSDVEFIIVRQAAEAAESVHFERFGGQIGSRDHMRTHRSV